MSDMPGGPPNWGKIAESLLVARVMCGSIDAAQGQVSGQSIAPFRAGPHLVFDTVRPTVKSPDRMGTA